MVEITNTLISRNIGHSRGGGVSVGVGSYLNISYCNITDNVVAFDGSGLHNSGNVTMTSIVLSNNTGSGGAITNDGTINGIAVHVEYNHDDGIVTITPGSTTLDAQSVACHNTGHQVTGTTLGSAYICSDDDNNGNSLGVYAAIAVSVSILLVCIIIIVLSNRVLVTLAL